MSKVLKKLNYKKFIVEVAKLDNLLIWSFGRMIHSPLEDSANKDLYFSASRTYAVSAKAWTAIDPLLAWSPESLLTSHGNFNPLRYCDNDPVNFVDPSGYAKQHIDKTGSDRTKAELKDIFVGKVAKGVGIGGSAGVCLGVGAEATVGINLSEVADFLGYCFE